LKTQPATGETYPKSDLFNKAGSDTETCCNTGNKMATFNNLFVSFNLKFLRVSQEEATKSSLAIKICESQL
ncbi:TPA: hypothetical protein ACQ3C4_003719, partial [Klebsiella pneumoniae]